MKKINIELAKEKGLITNDDLRYQTLVYEYKYVLEYYLNSIIDFSKYENDISNSGLHIGMTTKYQDLNVYLKLNYICLINNLFAEKLNKEDIDLLMSKFNKENISIELIDLIKRTLKDVIKDNYHNGSYSNDIYKVCYGPMIPSNFVDNDSLVFKFFYGKNLVDVKNEEFLKLHQKQIDFIQNEMNLLKKEIFDKLNVKCEVLIKKDIK